MPTTNYKRQGWKAPLELRAHRTGLLGFGALALVLLLVGRAEIALVDQLRMEAADVARDVLGAAASGADVVSSGIDAVTGAVSLYAENARLKSENEALLAWRTKALELERRVQSFESMLNISYTPVQGITTASVIADTGGPFSRAIIVNAGERQGVRQGDAALDQFGLVGRVIAVGNGSARVLLLTDSTSHVPVVIEPGGFKAILSGDSDGLPQLQFLPPGTVLQDGMAIVTSGDGGVLPPGLPVGVVKLTPDGDPSAVLYADIARVEVVALKRYEFINDVDLPKAPPLVLSTPVPQEEPTVASNPIQPVE